MTGTVSVRIKVGIFLTFCFILFGPVKFNEKFVDPATDDSSDVTSNDRDPEVTVVIEASLGVSCRRELQLNWVLTLLLPIPSRPSK